MTSSSTNRQATAVKGGMGTISTPANSGGAGLFGTATGATHAGSPPSPKSPLGGGGRRRSSASGNGGMFANLVATKRSSLSEEGTARRISMEETQAKAGPLGRMWNNFTRGPAFGTGNPNTGSKQAEKPQFGT